MPVRDEHDNDHDAVRTIVRTAFGGHGDNVAALVDTLRRDALTVASFVAQDAGDVVGHVMFSRCLLDAPRRLVEVVALSPLSVAPPQQRRGFGSALVRHGLQELDARGVPLVFLEGDPRYYSRLGFVTADFRKPSLRIPDEGFQVVTLSAYEPWMTGTFVYSDAFWRHDCVGPRDI
jgi:putative acetyltransferase